jgi:penicillin-binding protein 2
MQKFFKPSRIAFLFVLVGLLLAVYLTTLYRLQLFDTGADANAYLTRDTTSKKELLTANRGDILDRNGELLVSTRAAYNVALSWTTLKERDDYNDIILKLVHTAVDNGVAYNDTFPVTQGAPFSYVSNMTKFQQKRLKAYLEFSDYFDIGPNISASDLIVKMKEHYGIDYTMNITDARLVIGVRYELELRAIVSLDPYVFADDVGIDFIMLLQEMHLPGVSIETSAVRVYHTTYAAHILGYTGSMSQDEYDNFYKPLGYSYNAQIGKDGAEAAFESYLHGTDGEQITTISDDGTILDEETTKEPVPGANVFLSIDIGLQAVSEDALTAKIDEINADREDTDRVSGGAVVVTDVKTGEVLSCASYPTYDPSTLAVTIGDMITNQAKPMYDRATMGLYNPGSTFKMVTALAGFKMKAIDLTTTFNCTGLYTKYLPDTLFKCWVYGETGYGHGDENVIGALRDSCDYFFYSVADMIGSRAIEYTAVDFGFGAKTGIELLEKAGIISTPENKWNIYGEDYYTGNVLQSAIGQDINTFTPVQMANYVATIANGGTLYKLTMLNNIRSADFTTVLYKPQPTVMNLINGREFLPYIQEGMRQVCTGGTAKGTFKDYPIAVAAKTGTVQLESSLANEALNTGVFVCYAPYDDPEIAIAIVVEKGTSGATIADIAKNICDYYFRAKPNAAVAEDNTLLP